MIDYITGLLGPLFMVALLALGVRAWLGIRGTVVKGPACKACGYSREGIPIESPCPECGKEQKYPGSVMHIRKRTTIRSTKRITTDLILIVAVVIIAYGTIKLDDYRLNLYQDFVTAIKDGDLTEVQDYLNKYPELANGRFRYINDLANPGGPLVHVAQADPSDRKALVRLLINHGATPDALHHGELFRLCIANNDTALMGDLLQAGFDINAFADRKQEAWLSITLLYNRQTSTTLKFLLDNGADPNRFVDRPPLIQAVGHENKAQVIKMLLDAGADPNVVDQHGYTPLMYAVNQQCIACIKLLLEAGAEDTTSPAGTTAEDIARHLTRRSPEKDPTAEAILEFLIQQRLGREGEVRDESDRP